MTDNHNSEKIILSKLYSNNADSIKFLPFFFRDKKDLRHFFNMFGGKTLVLPDTFEDFIKELLLDSDVDDENRKGIDKNIHERTKNKIIESYISLFATLQDVIENECGSK